MYSRTWFYFFLGFLNICFFSIISISLYQLFCTSVELSNFNTMYNTSFLLNIKFEFCIFQIPKFNTESIYVNSNIWFFSFFSNYIFIYRYFFFTSNFYLNIIDNFYYDIYSYETIFKVYFFTKKWVTYDSLTQIFFFCLHDFIWVIPNETTLVFFRLINESNKSVECLSIYMVYPLEYSYFLVKLQCFCFSNLMINSFSIMEMPVIFFFEADFFFLNRKKIYFFYLLLVY